MNIRRTYMNRLIAILTIVMMGVSSAMADIWDGITKTAPDMSTNKGTSEALAIQITKAAELAWLGDQMKSGNTANGKTYGNKYWKLTADIDLGGNSTFTGNDWASMIGHTGNAFCGYFNGNNKTISNIQVAAVSSTKYYGLFPSIQGESTTKVSIVNNLKINGVFIQATVSCANNTRLGGLAGYAKQADISNIEVRNVTFTYTNTITNINQLGGLIGCIENDTKIDNVAVVGVTATFSNTTTSLYVGGLVGASTGTANTNSITNCDVKTVKFTHTSNVTGATYVGGLVGNANTSLNNISNNVTDGFTANVSGTSKNFYAGGFFGYCKGSTQEIKKNAVKNVLISTIGDINDARLSGFIGSADGTGGIVSIKGNTITTVSVTSNGTTSGTNYLGGIIGYTKGKSSPNERVLIQGNTVTNPTVTMNGKVNNGFYEGGFLGYADEHVNVYNNKVTKPTITIANDINAETYVGGAVGRQTKNTIIDGMQVSGGSISGPSTSKVVKNSVAFFVGGFIGQMNSSGTANYQPDKFMNIAVTGIDINLANYVPDGIINNHKFAVGGIAGSVNAPNRDVNGFCGMPENIIFKGGKIYAPWASTSPTVSNFNASNPSHNTMTTEVITTIDALDKSRVKSWYYSDYKLGLSAEFLGSTSVIAYNEAPAKDKFRKNYSVSPKKESGISYITVKNTTFLRQNRYQDSERDSWTVLHWTTTNGYNAAGATATWFTNEEQPMYPYQSKDVNLKDYPYYMYFYQGVANATYTTAAVSDKIIEGIEGNFKEAQKEKPLVLTIANSKESVRGFDALTISVKAMVGEDDVTNNYSYQWYVDGKAKTTATSFSLRPHWKNGQGITLNALKDGVVVATATYTLRPGVMKTKKNDDIVGGNIACTKDFVLTTESATRGTKDNPYIIDCEEALRQWSYLSSGTSIRWEGIGVPVDAKGNGSNQTLYHYNRAYYELSKDITMSNTDFVPISHVGYGSDGSWGSYSNNFIFQGHFDGKLHVIKNLHMKWRAGQYNGNDANIYYGLFGAVGHSTATAKWGEGTTTSNTVVKNLVIDGAVLTHDVSNTTFSYQKDYKHITAANANNCMVGVLAGVVASNTTIQNIEIRNSKITDEGSEEYSLATKGLYVGGAIGSVQSAYNKTDAVPGNLTIDHVAANVNISLNKAAFQSVYADAKKEMNLFNVGGIIGRFITTSGTQAQVQNILPKYTIFSGDVFAPKAWVSPVLASLRYTSNQKTDNFTTYSKQWEGNNNAAGTQISITNAHYYNYRIDGKLITELYPDNKCSWGARSIASHVDGGGTKEIYTAKMFQGVNYGAIWVDAEGSSLKTLNENKVEDTYWTWEKGFVHMTKTPCLDAYLTSVENTEGTGVELTANMSDESTGTYRWQESFDGASWIDLDGETLQSYPSAYVNMPKLIVSYIKVGGKEYRTLPFMVHAINMSFSPYLESEGKDDRFTFEVKWKDNDVPNSSYGVTYQWCKSDGLTPIEGKTANTLELDKAGLDDAGGFVWCVIKLNYMGKEITKFSVRSYLDATVIYVNGNNYAKNGAEVGNDSNDGLSPQTPVKTIDKANSLLDPKGTWNNNIIVVMGTLNSDGDFRSTGKNPATLTGKWAGTDYEGVIKIKQINAGSSENDVNPVNQPGKIGSNCYVKADTKFEYLIFEANSNTAGNNFIECHGNDVWFGKGLVMTGFSNFSKAHGNLNMLQNIPELTIVLTATNLSEEDIKTYTNRNKPQVLTIESGHYGRVLAGRYTNGFFAKSDNTSHAILGSPEHPVWAIVNIDIEKENPNKGVVNRTEDPKGTVVDNYTLDINCIIAGLTDGSMYGDYTINVHGGKVGYIVGGNQGNPVANGTAIYKNAGVDDDKYLKAWGQWPNATYFGRTIINVEQGDNLADIKIDNLYAGGLGREKNGSDGTTTVVDMYYYGHSEVNIKSGTVGSVYAGGAGGVMGVNPWDAHLPYATTDADDVEKAIINKVQYGDTRRGTWSSMVNGTASIAKVTLHNLNETGDGYVVESLKLDSTSATVNIMGGTINGNVYGGGYGFVQDMPAEVTMQGIGSVFGDAYINITGGAISGSVYGGSQGHELYYNKVNNYGQTITHIAEMNGTVNLKISGDEFNYPTIGGDIYGAGKGLEAEIKKATQADVEEGKAVNVGDTYTEEYLRIATTGNKDLLGEDHETNVNIVIDLPENAPFNGNIYGGGEFGVVDGNTNIVIKRGTFNGNIFGGGKGKNNEANRNKAKISGSTNVKIGE